MLEKTGGGFSKERGCRDGLRSGGKTALTSTSLVFVEVRSKSNERYDSPAETEDQRKLQKATTND